MQKAVGMLLLLAGASMTAMATAVPEIDPGSAGSAVALIAGAVLIIRSRKK
jgi:hypothetical protein